MVVFEHVAREFNGAGRESVAALKDFNLEARAGELLVLVGPSGSGKTTALRLLAGLEQPDRGSIRLDGKSMDGVKPKDRDVAMVFQQPALFPHLTVFQNMAFGLILRKYPAAQIRQRVGEAAELLNLTKLLERRPATLSGGEAQRAALGRALARQPKVFLLDEPLSNLDAPLRLQLRNEIAALHRRLGTTMLFVTHDQMEAVALADRIAVVHQGQAQQIAPPKEILEQPANAFVAEFMASARAR
jgi:multiple sugar transport system ATP-binding protein